MDQSEAFPFQKPNNTLIADNVLLGRWSDMLITWSWRVYSIAVHHQTTPLPSQLSGPTIVPRSSLAVFAQRPSTERLAWVPNCCVFGLRRNHTSSRSPAPGLEDR